MLFQNLCLYLVVFDNTGNIFVSHVFVFCVCVCVSYLCCRHAYWLVWTAPLTSTYTTSLKNSFGSWLYDLEIFANNCLLFYSHSIKFAHFHCTGQGIHLFSSKIDSLFREGSIACPFIRLPRLFVCWCKNYNVEHRHARRPPSLLNTNISVFPSSLCSCFIVYIMFLVCFHPLGVLFQKSRRKKDRRKFGLTELESWRRRRRNL